MTFKRTLTIPPSQAGNVGPATTFNWTVDLVSPTLTLLTQPASLVNSTRAFLAFSANDSTPTCLNCEYTCQLDGGPVDSCSTGGSIGQVTYLNLLDGLRRLVITVTNPVGLTATRVVTWTVDTIDPLPAIDLGASPTNRNPLLARVTFSKPCVNLGFVSCANGSASANKTANATCGVATSVGAKTLSLISVTGAKNVAGGAIAQSLTTMTVSLTPSATGMYDISMALAPGVCVDSAGNPSPAAFANVTFNDVRGRPVISTDIPATTMVFDNQTYAIRRTNAGLLNYTVGFGNPVTGFASKSIVVVGGTAGEVSLSCSILKRRAKGRGRCW
jgi:hypothetical protein